MTQEDLEPDVPLAVFLRERREAILTTWLERIREESNTRHLPEPALIDHLPELLDRLAVMTDALEAGQSAELPASTAERHALERLEEGFDLAEVVGEFALLRDVILEHWENHPRTRHDRRVAQIIHRAVDQTIMASVDRYVGARERVLRALDQISTAAIEVGGLDAFLDRLLEIFRETTPAVDTAVVLLIEGDVLVPRATVGLRERIDEGLTIPIGQGFAGTIASTRTPMMLHHASTDPIVLSQAIKQKGVRALYGVPLADGDELLGVVHIGSFTAYEFSGQDCLLLKALASRAAAGIRMHALRDEAEAARTALAASEERLRLLIENVPEYAILMLDPRGVIATWNVGAERMFGYRAGEIVGAHFSILYPREAIERGDPDDKLRRTVARTRDYEEGVHVRKDGSTFVASVVFSAILDPQGDLLGFAKVIRDLTRDRRASEALRASEAKLRSAMRVGRIGSWEWELAAGRIAVSREFLALLGLDPDEPILFERYFERVHPDDRGGIRARVEELVGGSADEFRSEFRVTIPNQTERWMTAFGQVLERRSGVPVRIVGVMQDTTERKRTELALRFLEDASRALASSLELSSVVDRVCRIAVPVMADLALVHLLDDGQLTLQGVAHADPERERQVCALSSRHRHLPPPPRVMRMLETGRPEVHKEIGEEFLATYTRGPAHAEEAHALELRSSMLVPLVARGRSLGVLSLFSVESKREYGSADLSFVEQLASRAAMAIDNARLYEETRRAVQVRDRILAVVSHDLKNPLNSVDMATALLLGDAAVRGNDRMRRLLETVQRSAARMDRLIRDLLDMSSIQAGQLKIERSPCAIYDLVIEAIELHEPLALEKGISLRRLLAVDGYEAACDRDRMLQVFSNLIGNAIKFGKAGDEVLVRAEVEPGIVHFTVTDDGPGIAPDEVPRIFDLYWQGTHDSRRGTGLGLFITKGIVEAHGGRVWAESALGEGTSVHFTLPTMANARR